MLFNPTLHVWFSPSRVVRWKFFKNRGFTLHSTPIQAEQMWFISSFIIGIVLKIRLVEKRKNA